MHRALVLMNALFDHLRIFGLIGVATVSHMLAVTRAMSLLAQLLKIAMGLVTGVHSQRILSAVVLRHGGGLRLITPGAPR